MVSYNYTCRELLEFLFDKFIDTFSFIMYAMPIESY